MEVSYSKESLASLAAACSFSQTLGCLLLGWLSAKDTDPARMPDLPQRSLFQSALDESFGCFVTIASHA